MFSPGSAETEQAQRNVAPRFEETELQSSNAAGDSQGVAIADGADQVAEANVTAGDYGEERVRVTADDSNNSLLILAAATDYKRVLAILENLDVSPRQVLIEATIAEVSLNDDLKFGVRWYFQDKQADYMFTDLASKAFGSVFPGFSYALEASDVQVTLDALNKVTRVNIVSAPSLMVLANRTATLQIGDQVPIVTQSATGVQAEGAPRVRALRARCRLPARLGRTPRRQAANHRWFPPRRTTDPSCRWDGSGVRDGCRA
jgi:general secretion pathway protein D